MSRGTKVALWSLGGCGVLVLLLVIGSLVFGAIVATRTFNIHLDSRAPADFPVYPGSQLQTGVSLGAKNHGAAGSFSLVQWSVAANTDMVMTWYKEHLDQGDWAYGGEESGVISFHRRSTGAVAHLVVRNQVTQTLVQLEVAGEQPLDAGAHPATTDVPSPDASP
ncbi:MAG: hypothetical protein ACR2MY_08345 [Candidatus Dormibacteria bacterium]